jgi:hypothetical protein
MTTQIKSDAISRSLCKLGDECKTHKSIAYIVVTSILSMRCYDDVFLKYKNSYIHVKRKKIRMKII